MMHMNDFQINEDTFEADTMKLLKILRPDWAREEVVTVRFFYSEIANKNSKFRKRFLNYLFNDTKPLIISTFADGLSNKVVCCYEEKDKDRIDAICVRVHGYRSEYFIDRDAEIRHVMLLQSAGCAAPLYCRFTNGIAYKFIPGKCVDRKSIRDPTIRRLIAKEMVRWHSIVPSRIPRPENLTEVEPVLFKRIRLFLDMLPQNYPDLLGLKSFGSKEELLAEVDDLEKNLSVLGSPVTFCHNDLLPNNIVYNETKGTISFIDHEYSGFNYMAFDIADHFNEYVGTSDQNFSRYPDREYQLEWIKTYLEYKLESEGKPVSDVSQKDVDSLYVQVAQFSLASNFTWGAWGLIMASISSIDFDYLGCSKMRLEEYFKKKKEYLALKLPG